MKPLAGKIGNSSLTEMDVRQIRKNGKTVSTRALAEAYGVGIETVRKIIRRDTWQWVEDAVGEDELMQKARESEARMMKLMELQNTAVVKVDTALGELSEEGLNRLRLFTEVGATAEVVRDRRVPPPSPLDGGEGGVDETGGVGIKTLERTLADDKATLARTDDKAALPSTRAQGPL